MEMKEISIHEVRICRYLQTGGWFTNSQIAKGAEVSERTARASTLRLYEIGVIDRASLFPGFRYRWADKDNEKAAGYLLRLKQAMDVFEQQGM